MKVRILKRIISLFLLMLLPFIMLSCDDGFTAPSIVYNENTGLIYWENISKASYYEININGDTKYINYSFYDLSELDKGDYVVSVRAVKDGLIKEYSNYSNEITISLDGKSQYVWTGDVTLNDVEEIVNEISTNIIKSIFTIYTKPYYIMTTGQTKSNIYGNTIQGSGVIVKKDNTSCYILTNNHVVIEGDSKYTRCEYTVKDYKGSSYSASIIYNDPNYDLAILSFTPIVEGNLIDYPVLDLETSNAIVDDKVIAISTPHGQTNCITFGKVLGEEFVTSTDDEKESNINFTVLKHSAILQTGSSGSPLLSYNLKLVGINFAIKNSNSESISYTIPLNKVNDFLEKTSIWN